MHPNDTDSRGYRGERFETPDRFRKFISGYDLSAEEIQDMDQRNPDVLFSIDLDLSVAQAPTNPVVINSPGRHVVIYGFNTANKYSATANTGTENPNQSVMVNCRINKDQPGRGYILKHARGFSGSFNKLFLSWPAQGAITARLIVLKYDAAPWSVDTPDSPAPNSFGVGQKTVATAGTSVQLTATQTPCSSVTVKALAGNASAKIFIGSASGDNRAPVGYEMNKQEGQTIAIDDVSKVWIDSDTNGAGVSYLYS